MLFENFHNGINIGGWLAQYEIVTGSLDSNELERHFETFITEDNIKYLSSTLGLDHIRIPLDGDVIFDYNTGKLIPCRISYLDRMLSWCRKQNLNVIFDLHTIRGNAYHLFTPTDLFTKDEYRANFVRFWKEMTTHYIGVDTPKIVFELLNEAADCFDGYLWRSLYDEAVQSIRDIDPNRYLLIGSNCMNSLTTLNQLKLYEDDQIGYNFHYYEPNAFTHQKACFSEEFIAFDRTINYPGSLREYQTFLAAHPSYKQEHPMVWDVNVNDENLMNRNLGYADRFIRYTGKELYCGEYGVIDTAPEMAAAKWIRDFKRKCDQLRVGHAMWNYKCLDFELVDIDNHLVRPLVEDAIKSE